MRDYSMLELFRQEVETQVTNLQQSLSIPETGAFVIGQRTRSRDRDRSIRSQHLPK